MEVLFQLTLAHLHVCITFLYIKLCETGTLYDVGGGENNDIYLGLFVYNIDASGGGLSS